MSFNQEMNQQLLYIHTMEYNPAIKEAAINGLTIMYCKDTFLMERNQTTQGIHHVVSII